MRYFINVAKMNFLSTVMRLIFCWYTYIFFLFVKMSLTIELVLMCTCIDLLDLQNVIVPASGARVLS